MVNLLFGVHNHQPVGNFKHIFQKATQDCYRPFIETLYRYVPIKATLHFSGSLIDWLLENDPALLAKVKEMVQRQQVEILTGGYYEPILPVIPEEDRRGQINMLTDFIRDYFECQPQGMWIGERVWEPNLAKSLIQVGIKYILLDDFHFRYAGISAENLLGYYMLAEEGAQLAAFPINKRLRYTIPFSQRPLEPIKYFRSLASKEGKEAAIIVDDGEKFGLWPGTHKWVYQKRWLERFFQLLLQNQDCVKTQTISEYMSKFEPLGLCSLPSASYEEMMSWSGGRFSNFFRKYPEANNLYRRMLYVSKEVNQQQAPDQKAKRYLYMGQSNCPYWHGVFGGIYLRHLRHTAYKNLITAQTLVDEQKKASAIETRIFDFDQDGREELIIKSKHLQIFIAPHQGGRIFELDYKPKPLNLLDVLTRKEESYHQQIKNQAKKRFTLKKKTISSIHDLLKSKEKNLENFLIYDSYRRASLLDHFLPKGTTLADLKDGHYEELGDFINAAFSLKLQKEGSRVSIILRREGSVNYNGQKVPLRIEKELSLNNEDAQVAIEYKLENLSAIFLDIIFGVEFNISPESEMPPNNLRTSGEWGLRVNSLKEDVETSAIEKLHLQDVHSGIEMTFSFNKKANLWAYPLETVSCSEEGFERNYQQTVIIPHWPIRLEQSWQVKFKLKIASTRV